MARYTITLFEFVNSLWGVNGRYPDWTSEEGILQTAETIIPGNDFMHLKPSHRLPFRLAFVLHYCMEEIGFESMPLFQLKLREKMSTYGSYIDNIMDLAETDLFQRRRVRRVWGNELQDRNADRVTSRDVGHTADYVRDNQTIRASSSTQNSVSDRSGDSEETRNLTDHLDAHLQRNTDSQGGDSGSSVSNSALKNTQRMSDTPQDELEPIESNAYLTEATITDQRDGSEQTHTNQNNNNTSSNEDNLENRASGGTVTTADSSKSKSDITQAGESDRREHGTNSVVDETHAGESHVETAKRKTDWGRNEDESILEYATLMSMSPVINKLWPLLDDLFMFMVI